MRDWPTLPPDDELERADSLLNQADALLRRHRVDDKHADATADDWAPGAELDGDDDDLPILTEIVEDYELPPALPRVPSRSVTGFDRAPAQSAALHETARAPLSTPGMPTPAQTTATADTAIQDALSARLAERLVKLDTEIAREIGNWVAAEIPQILARELDQLAARVQAEMQAHLRATLLPEISARVGRLLDPAADPLAKPDRPLDN
jgi:hypothetical protein